MASNLLWVEKFRPDNIDDCVLPVEIKNVLNNIVNTGEVPNLLLFGTSGIGKTTVAKALCNQLGCDWLMINGSNEGRMIDTLRTTITNYASTVSFSGGKKIIIIDEADYMNKDSVQPAMRGLIEEFSNNCRFFFTCNYKNKILPSLHSRCSVIDFKINREDKPELAKKFSEIAMKLLDSENIKYKPDVVAKLVVRYFPDFRRVLNELQNNAVSGKIDASVLEASSNENFNQLIGFLKEKDFTQMRKWVAQNIDNDHVGLYRQVYDSMFSNIKKQSVPDAVLIIADYSYKSAFVADQEINMVACLTELMMNSEFN